MLDLPEKNNYTASIDSKLFATFVFLALAVARSMYVLENGLRRDCHAAEVNFVPFVLVA